MFGTVYSCVWQLDFLEKIKIGQKWPKNMVFGLFKEIMSLVFSGICVNQSSYGSLTSCKSCMLGKNLVLKLKTNMALGQWDFSIY